MEDSRSNLSLEEYVHPSNDNLEATKGVGVQDGMAVELSKSPYGRAGLDQ